MFGLNQILDEFSYSVIQIDVNPRIIIWRHRSEIRSDNFSFFVVFFFKNRKGHIKLIGILDQFDLTISTFKKQNYQKN